MLANEYQDGESQRSRDADTSRKRWETTRRLTPTALASFWTFFYTTLSSQHDPFYFYDPWDTSPKFSYDPTGSATTGRYVVRRDSPWEQVAGMIRLEIPISLVEIG